MKLTATERMRKKFEKDVPGHGAFAAKGIATKAEFTQDERSFWAWVSTATPDQEGDVVIPTGADFSYFPGRKAAGLDPTDDGGVATVYLNHHYDRLDDIVGKCRRIKVAREGDKWGLKALTFVATGELGDQVLRLIREGVIRGMSIGFRVNESSPPDKAEADLYGPMAKRVIRSYRLVEYSVTAMPMNQEALIDINTVKSMASTEVLRALEIDTEPRRVVVDIAPRRVSLPKIIY